MLFIQHVDRALRILQILRVKVSMLTNALRIILVSQGHLRLNLFNLVLFSNCYYLISTLYYYTNMSDCLNGLQSDSLRIIFFAVVRD